MRSTIMTSLIAIIVLHSSYPCFGQRPMHISQIMPKIDSIQVEADKLYAYEMAYRYSKTKQDKVKNINDNRSYLIYEKYDTTKLIYYKGDTVDFESNFINNVPLSINATHRTFKGHESHLVALQNKVIQQIRKEYSNIDVAEHINEHRKFIIPFKEGYKFYLLDIPDDSNTISFGRDYLFYLDLAGKVTSIKVFHSETKTTIELKHNTDSTFKVLVNTDRDDCYIYATDILKFRLTNPKWFDNQGFEVYSRKNRRTYYYDAKKNKINLLLHPNEKKQ